MPNGVGAFFFEVCDSTNARAATLAIAGEPGPLWVVAGEQSAGRGRRGRSWTSKTGNLYASLMFRPHIRPQDLAALPFIVALAVRDTFLAFGAPESHVQCKWPNDILIGERKASGVLIESSAKHGGMLDYVIIGIGMNLVHFPDDAAFGATSLLHVTGQEVSVKDAATVLAEKLYARIDAWKVDDFRSVAEEWTRYSWGLGQSRELRTHDETFTATLLGLSDDGALIARLDDGLEKRLYAGDVFPVERAD
ncbi:MULTISPECIES: biotin--[acetyl-CoA-carboxylase] ligase [Kordiimonas]|jgi:BirA family biotin operon repressor/biotin-[acetyl-CoA-carboxylase] ligase|uniref:biotin--[acetyl-CoA-carboxylase] ligase n=1 Tax=Kordiimonas TaxID=288021 RepID=UPI00257C9C3A|nr:biotin--[acetyl-CoA-carboxylase] ligase [Kordiimonas sp. UBA4487]